MRTKFYHWYNVLLATLMGMLGFQSCGDDPGEDEYGCPYVDYQVRGTVTDAEGQPVRGIKVKLEEQYPGYGTSQVSHHGLDSVQTDAQGAYQTRLLEDGGFSPYMKLIVEDIDGPDNGGEFQSDTLDLTQLPRKQVKKGKGWYEGRYELTGDVTLKLRLKDEE